MLSWWLLVIGYWLSESGFAGLMDFRDLGFYCCSNYSSIVGCQPLLLVRATLVANYSLTAQLDYKYNFTGKSRITDPRQHRRFTDFQNEGFCCCSNYSSIVAAVIHFAGAGL